MGVDTLDIVSYKNAIQRLADSKDKEMFANTGIEHACTVMASIFRTSQVSLKIFAGKLNGDVSKGEYLDNLEIYLKSGKPLNVILQEKPADDCNYPAINLIKKYIKPDSSNNITVSYIDESYLENNKINGKVYHFAVGDDRMFRLETDTTNYTAVCSFNNPDVCSVLDKLFSGLSTNAVKVY